MSHRILLVDDEVDILEFVRYNLVREGYEVFTAENGAEALKVAVECRPHLILLDMMMPVMDGAQTCRAIRRNPVLKDTMVVFLSALGEEGQQLAGFDVGADDYLTKPIKMKLLVSRVQAILKRIDADRPPEKAPAPGLTVDRERYTVIRDGQEITLPRKEFALLTLLMVLFICFNAAWNAQKRSKYIDKAFLSSFIAITTGAGLTLAVLVFSGSIAFVPMQVIPIAGMVAGNAMVAVGLCYNNMGQRFSSEQQQIQEKLSLGATPKMAAARLIRESIRASLIPTVDSAKTVGLVSLPGMMSGLIFAGIDPVKAIKYQIMVTFMLLSTASLSTIIAGYLTYRKFFNARHQLVVTQLKKHP